MSNLNIYNANGVKYDPKRELSILFVGNSLTQDGIAYLPYMLKTYYPDIRFRFYMCYTAGVTLGGQYNIFVNNTPYQIFSVAENTAEWTNFNNAKTMAQILSSYTFDIVCMMEMVEAKESYTDMTDWNNCEEYIRANYMGGNPLKFITLYPAPIRNNIEHCYTMGITAAQNLLKMTTCEDVLANGLAVYFAFSTALDSLGDAGHLSPDGIHTQEGLPCLLQTYVTLLWILDKYGINVSIYGDSTKMTTAIYNTINVPGPNLGSGVITGTDAENYLAQRVAIIAFKAGKNLVSGVDYFS